MDKVEEGALLLTKVENFGASAVGEDALLEADIPRWTKEDCGGIGELASCKELEPIKRGFNAFMFLKPTLAEMLSKESGCSSDRRLIDF